MNPSGVPRVCDWHSIEDGARLDRRDTGRSQSRDKSVVQREDDGAMTGGPRTKPLAARNKKRCRSKKMIKVQVLRDKREWPRVEQKQINAIMGGPNSKKAKMMARNQ